MKPVAISRKNWIFSGSDIGGKAMAIASPSVETAKMNRVEPQAGLTVGFAGVADDKITRIDVLIPWRDAAQAKYLNKARRRQSSLTERSPMVGSTSKKEDQNRKRAHRFRYAHHSLQLVPFDG